MTTTDESKSSEPMPLDHILESAVVINRSDLVRGAIPGLIRGAFRQEEHFARLLAAAEQTASRQLHPGGETGDQ